MVGYRNGLVMLCVMTAGCSSLAPHTALDRPPRDIPQLEEGQTVAQLSPEGIHVTRSEVTDYKPLDCQPIAEMRDMFANQMRAGSPITVFGAGMRSYGQPTTGVSNFQKFDSALRRCRAAQTSYRQGAVRLVRVNTEGPLFAKATAGQSGFTDHSRAAFVRVAATKADTNDHSCYALQDWHGRFLPVRSDADDPYRFRFDVPRRAYLESTAQGKVTEAKVTLTDLQQKQASTKRALRREKAFQDGQCVRPAQEPIPPRPTDVMAPDKVEYHAVGGCMKQIYATFKHSEASDAFGRYGLYKEMDLARKWSTERGYNESSCGLNNLRPSEMQAEGLSVWASNLGLRAPAAASIKALYDTCVMRARYACNGKLLSWKSQRAWIIAAPEQALQSCTKKLMELTVYDVGVPMAEKSLDQAQAEQRATLVRTRSMNRSTGDAALSRCSASPSRAMQVTSEDGLPTADVIAASYSQP